MQSPLFYLQNLSNSNKAFYKCSILTPTFVHFTVSELIINSIISEHLARALFTHSCVPIETTLIARPTGNKIHCLSCVGRITRSQIKDPQPLFSDCRFTGATVMRMMARMWTKRRTHKPNTLNAPLAPFLLCARIHRSRTMETERERYDDHVIATHEVYLYLRQVLCISLDTGWQRCESREVQRRTRWVCNIRNVCKHKHTRLYTCSTNGV